MPRLSGSILVKLPFFAGGPSELLAPASLAGRLVDIFTFFLQSKCSKKNIYIWADLRWLKKRKHCHHLFHGQKIINRFNLNIYLMTVISGITSLLCYDPRDECLTLLASQSEGILNVLSIYSSCILYTAQGDFHSCLAVYRFFNYHKICRWLQFFETGLYMYMSMTVFWNRA